MKGSSWGAGIHEQVTFLRGHAQPPPQCIEGRRRDQARLGGVEFSHCEVVENEVGQTEEGPVMENPGQTEPSGVCFGGSGSRERRL